MNQAAEKQIEAIKSDPSSFLKFLKIKFPLFHNSVFFMRDLQFGLEKFLRLKEVKIPYRDLEKLAGELSILFEKSDIFIKIKDHTWKVNYPEFVTQVPGDPL